MNINSQGGIFVGSLCQIDMLVDHNILVRNHQPPSWLPIHCVNPWRKTRIWIYVLMRANLLVCGNICFFSSWNTILLCVNVGNMVLPQYWTLFEQFPIKDIVIDFPYLNNQSVIFFAFISLEFSPSLFCFFNLQPLYPF